MSNLLNLFNLAQSAGTASRQKTQLATENLFGAQDPEYIKRTTTIDIQVAAGRLMGVVTNVPQRVMDEKLVGAQRDQQSILELDDVKKEYLELLDDLNGSEADKGSMDQKLLNFLQKISSLTLEPGSPIVKRNTVEAIKEFLKTIQRFAEGINTQRNSAERDIIASVGEINNITKDLFMINQQVSHAMYEGQDFTQLETQREALASKLSKLLNIQVIKNSDNNFFVYTSSGKPLVEYKLYPVSYTSSGIIDYSAEYPTNINPINLLDDMGHVEDITKEITGGKIGGCLEMRDTIYPNYQKTIDKFAEIFQQHMNHIHNKGSGFPPTPSLEGGFFITEATKDVVVPWKDDSVVRIALVDDKGKFAESGGVFKLDLNLNPGGGGALTPIQIRDAINTAFGSTVASFSEHPTANPADDYGYLTLTAPGSLRIAIGSVDGSPEGETLDNIGFSEYFKLNDLIESSPTVSGRGYANSLKMKGNISKDASFFSTGILNSSLTAATFGTVENMTAVASGDSNNLTKLRDLINSLTITFPAAGVMPIQNSSFLGYLTNLVNLVHLDASSAIENYDFSEGVLDGLQERHSKISGVNQDEEISEVMSQKIYYNGVLSTSKHIMDMLNSLLDLFSRA